MNFICDVCVVHACLCLACLFVYVSVLMYATMLRRNLTFVLVNEFTLEILIFFSIVVANFVVCILLLHLLLNVMQNNAKQFWILVWIRRDCFVMVYFICVILCGICILFSNMFLSVEFDSLQIYIRVTNVNVEAPSL